jgi:hypothetical protein
MSKRIPHTTSCDVFTVFLYDVSDHRTSFPSGEIVTEMARNVILSFLKRCDIPLPSVDYDYDFDTVCRAEAVRRGYPMEGPNSLAPFIPGGVVMVITAYAHLTDKSTRLFISLYTAFLIYTDDVFQYQVDAVREFNERFVAQKRQEDPVLDSFASLLLEFSQHFSTIASNIMITSTLNLVTALSLEYDTRGMGVIAIHSSLLHWSCGTKLLLLGPSRCRPLSNILPSHVRSGRCIRTLRIPA